MNSPEILSNDALPWKQIVAKAVHDIRTPLSTMHTTLEILRILPAGSSEHGRIIGILETQVNDIAGQLEILIADPESFLNGRQCQVNDGGG